MRYASNPISNINIVYLTTVPHHSEQSTLIELNARTGHIFFGIGCHIKATHRMITLLTCDWYQPIHNCFSGHHQGKY